MAKNEFARGQLLFNLTGYGITDVSIDEVWTEIDVTDTESTIQESEFLGGRRSYNVSFTLFKNAGSADLVLNRQPTSQTSGTITVGVAYRLTDWITNDDFTNVGAGSNADGIEFIATGTTPTTYTNSSVVTTMIECQFKVLDSAGNFTTYEGNLILLTKNIAGTIDDAVKVTYTGRITGALTEAQG